MDQVAYSQGFDDAACGNKSSVKRTESGHFKLSREILIAIEDVEEQDEYAESYLQGFAAANASQAW